MVRKCENCGHNIEKVKGKWKHSDGGTYCKATWRGNKPLLGGCLCNEAEPIKEPEAIDDG